MKLLAIDTAANLCAACVYDADRDVVLGQSVRDIGKGHAEQLMDVIAEALEGAGLTYGDLSRIGVTVGPGSFTGVRVGVSTARGLALALGIPAIGVTTLEALAAGERAVRPDKDVLAVIDAGRGTVYAAIFDTAGEAVLAPQLTTVDDIAGRVTPDMVISGSAASAVAEAANAPGLAGSVTAATGAIGDIAFIAASRKPEGKPSPLYLRAPDAKPQAGFVLPRKVD